MGKGKKEEWCFGFGLVLRDCLWASTFASHAFYSECVGGAFVNFWTCVSSFGVRGKSLLHHMFSFHVPVSDIASHSLSRIVTPSRFHSSYMAQIRGTFPKVEGPAAMDSACFLSLQ
jgi:hypothetical protein